MKRKYIENQELFPDEYSLLRLLSSIFKNSKSGLIYSDNYAYEGNTANSGICSEYFGKNRRYFYKNRKFRLVYIGNNEYDAAFKQQKSPKVNIANNFVVISVKITSLFNYKHEEKTAIEIAVQDQRQKIRRNSIFLQSCMIRSVYSDN